MCIRAVFRKLYVSFDYYPPKSYVTALSSCVSYLLIHIITLRVLEPGRWDGSQ
jgi:hypothetical protein